MGDREIDGRIDLGLTGDIELERLGLAGVALLKVGDLIGLPSGGDDVAARLEDFFGEVSAEAGGGSGDEPGAGWMFFGHVFKMLWGGNWVRIG